MAESTLKNKTAKGLFWGGISSGIQQIFQLICGFVMLKLLNAEEYGIVGILLIYNAIALAIQDSGFGIALINKKDCKNEDYNAVFWFSTLISLSMYIILFFCSPLIAKSYHHPELTLLSKVYFLSFLFSGIGVAQHAIIVKELMIKEKAKIEIIAVIVSGVIGVVLAINHFSYWAIAIQNVLYFLIAIIARWYYAPWHPTLSINFKPLRSMFSFSYKLLLTSVFVQAIQNIFSFVLGKYYDTKQLGYYTQGTKWSNMGSSVVTSTINGVAMPVLTRITSELERQQRVFRKMIRFGAFISFPLILGLAFVGREFLLIAGQLGGQGDKWQPAVPFLQLFCIWNSFYFLTTLYTSVIVTYEKSNIVMWGNIFTGSLQLIAVVSMFKFGIYPMVIAYVFSYFIGLLFWHYYANKVMGIKLWHVIKDILPYFATTIIAIICAWFILRGLENLYIRFLAKIAITATIYIAIMYFSNSIIFKESYNYILKKGK